MWQGKEADSAMLSDPQPPNWLRARESREVKDVHHVLLHAASVLPLWPKPSEEELASARPAHAARPDRTVENANLWVGGKDS